MQFHMTASLSFFYCFFLFDRLMEFGTNPAYSSVSFICYHIHSMVCSMHRGMVRYLLVLLEVCYMDTCFLYLSFPLKQTEAIPGPVWAPITGQSISV